MLRASLGYHPQFFEKYPNESRERRVAALAEHQHGHVTRKQLIELGFADGTISHGLRTGRLHRVYPGIYAVGHRRNAPIDRAAAAVLACGRGAVLSHSSAAALWGFTHRWQEPFEVTVTGDRRPRRIRVHRSQILLPRVAPGT